MKIWEANIDWRLDPEPNGTISLHETMGGAQKALEELATEHGWMPRNEYLRSRQKEYGGDDAGSFEPEGIWYDRAWCWEMQLEGGSAIMSVYETEVQP